MARWAAFLSLAVTLVATLSTPVTPPAEATLCPEGYVLGPDKEVVNSDGSVTRTPGDCVPAPKINPQGGLLGGLDLDASSPEIQVDSAEPIDIDLLPTPHAPDETQVESEGEAYLTIHAYLCEGEDDWSSKGLEQLRAACGAYPGQAFDVRNVLDDGNTSMQVVSSTDGDGLEMWTFSQPSTVIVDAVQPAGFIEPIVYCGLPSGPGLSAISASAGGAVALAVGSGQQMYCDWFNRSAPVAQSDSEPGNETDGGTVIVQKFTCPPVEMPKGQQPQSFAPLELRRDTGEPGGPVPGLCTEFELEIGVGFVFDASLDGQDLGSRTIGQSGEVSWTNVPAGELRISEQMMPGYGTPYFHCRYEGKFPLIEEFTGEVVIGNYPGGGTFRCIVINVPEYEGEGEVVVYKWECEHDPGLSDGMVEHLTNEGCEPMSGVPFSLSYGMDTVVDATTGVVQPGIAAWSSLPEGPVSVTETIPPGYGPPVVYCVPTFLGAPGPLAPFTPTVVDGRIDVEIEGGERLICHWINIPWEDGSITIYKYTCPEGYDLEAYGADPWADCPEATSGVAFTLSGQGMSKTSMTDGSGLVMWDGLDAGSYQIDETPPANTVYAFVLTCEGSSVPMIQNVPLSVGYHVPIEIADGDHVVCYWYNVPEPGWGTVVVIKYACQTEQFIAPEACEIYEHGVTFDLYRIDGGGQSHVSSGTTNSAGTVTWTGLPDGSYELEEIQAEWCYAESNRSLPDGTLEVVEGEETIVWVYNCGVKTTAKPPVKFPNTGVGSPMPLLASAGTAPVGLPGSHRSLLHNRLSGVLDSRIADALLGPDMPLRVMIPSIGVDAAVETLEIVDGAFQDPTTADIAAWYRETGSPGTPGNMVIAGHLNYWGDPEGVFFALERVEIGDSIVVEASDGLIHRYSVISVKQVEASAEALAEITAPSDVSAVTLITCGGDWDPASMMYRHRTVVRAEAVD
jgi:sortase (surface protein transpeptidase)